MVNSKDKRFRADESEVQPLPGTQLFSVGKAWAQNTINANILRHNSVASHEGRQVVADYNEEGRVVLAVRNLGSTQWEIHPTPFSGNTLDAHNVISLMMDGAGVLHLSWDHHASPLRYCRGVAPGSLQFTAEIPMTGHRESKVTYPEFHRLPDGNLLFLYRDGESGCGDVMINHYDLQTQQWTRVQDGFISGEGSRNAYWQMCIDDRGTLHMAWVWRDSPDVATNHDLAYAQSEDGGKTWLTSSGEPYELPITAASAEYAERIPQGHELINTTGISADAMGRPYIVSYWRPHGPQVPQYHLVYHDGSRWHTVQVGERRSAFTLSGGGTKRIPISRPLVVAYTDGATDKGCVIFRDEERGSRVSIARCHDLRDPSQWDIQDLTGSSVGMWEPSYDTEQWRLSKILHLYVQVVGQGDGETREDFPPSDVFILEWKPI
jgi:hypothetical protein